MSLKPALRAARISLYILGSEAFHFTQIPLMHMYGEVFFNYVVLGSSFNGTQYPLVRVFV